MWLEGAVWAEVGAWFTVEGLVAFAAGLGGTRRVWGLFGVAGRLSGTVSPFRADLGFPSRRGLTPRGSLECNPEIPVFP